MNIRLPSMIVTDADDAIKQLARNAERYGYENAMSELTEKSTTTIAGDSYYRLQQNYRGIPVYDRTVVCATDENGNVTSITGNVQDIDPNINSTPSITSEQAQKSIYAYIADVLHQDNTDVAISASTTCIYNGDKLAYVYTISLNSNFYETHEVLVDAHDASILVWKTYVASFESNQNVLDAADVNSDLDDSHNLKLEDTRRNHSIYCLDLRASQENPLVEDIIANDDFLAIAVPDQAAIGETYALAHLAQIYDFYSSVLGRQSYDNQGTPVYLFSCDADLLTDQGKSLACPEYGVIMLGAPENLFSEHLGKALDLIAHEYTHLVFQTEIGLSQNLDVTSINEGIADIFGNLIELYVEGEQDPSWPLAENAGYNKYNMADPITMASYGNEEHNNARILSHSAYLMWNGIDGTNLKKISTKDLAELWYRTMLMMPSDCDFSDCRQLVELAAASMDLDYYQIKCIRESFDTVGIYDNEPEDKVNYKLAPGSKLSVLDKNGDPYTGYTLEIYGLKNLVIYTNQGNWTRNSHIESPEYTYTQTIHDTSVKLDLPEGYYQLTITDSYRPDISNSVTVTITANANQDELILYTEYEHPMIVQITEPTSGPPDTESIYSAYIPAVEQAIQDTINCRWSDYEFAEEQRAVYGILADLDNDGTEELLLNYYDDSVSSNQIPYTVFSLYDYEAGMLKTVVDKYKIVGHVDTTYGYAGIVDYNGTPTILIRSESHNGTGSGTTTWYYDTLYSYPELTHIKSFEHTVSWNDGPCEYSIDENPVSITEFKNAISQCKYLEVNDRGAVDYTYEAMTLSELLAYLKANSTGDSSSTDLGKVITFIENDAWDSCLNVGSFEITDVEYAFQDVTGDGVEELIVSALNEVFWYDTMLFSSNTKHIGGIYSYRPVGYDPESNVILYRPMGPGADYYTGAKVSASGSIEDTENFAMDNFTDFTWYSKEEMLSYLKSKS